MRSKLIECCSQFDITLQREQRGFVYGIVKRSGMENEYIIKQVCILFHLSAKINIMVLDSKKDGEIYLRHVISLILILMNEYLKYKNPLFRKYEPYVMTIIH